MIVLPKKKQANHHANPTATATLTEQEIQSLLIVAQSHYAKDPTRPWLIAAQTRAVKKLTLCLSVIEQKKRKLGI